MIEHILLEKLKEFEYFLNNRFVKSFKLDFDSNSFLSEVRDFVNDYNENIDDDDEIEDDDKELEYISVDCYISDLLAGHADENDVDFLEHISISTENCFPLRIELLKLNDFFETIEGDRSILYKNEFYSLFDHISFLVNVNNNFQDLSDFENIYHLKYKINYNERYETFSFDYIINEEKNIELFSNLRNFIQLKIDQENLKINK